MKGEKLLKAGSITLFVMAGLLALPAIFAMLMRIDKLISDFIWVLFPLLWIGVCIYAGIRGLACIHEPSKSRSCELMAIALIASQFAAIILGRYTGVWNLLGMLGPIPYLIGATVMRRSWGSQKIKE